MVPRVPNKIYLIQNPQNINKKTPQVNKFLTIILTSRRPGGLRRLELLLSPVLLREHHVRLPGRPGGRAAAEAAALRLGLLLPGNTMCDQLM